MQLISAPYRGDDATGEALGLVDAAVDKALDRAGFGGGNRAAMQTQKALDAERFQGSGTPPPLVQAEMDALGLSAQAAAARIRQEHAQMHQFMARIEAVRLAARERIRTGDGDVFAIAKRARRDIEAIDLPA